MRLKDLDVGSVVSFTTSAPQVFGNFVDVYFAGIITGPVASMLGVDILAMHANAYGGAPEGTPNNPMQYEWAIFLEGMQRRLVGLPYINEVDLTLSQNVTYTLNVITNGKTEEELREILSVNNIGLISITRN